MGRQVWAGVFAALSLSATAAAQDGLAAAPADIRAEWEATHDIKDGVSCRFVEWAADPESKAPEGLARMTRPFNTACTLPLDDLTTVQAEALLKDKGFGFDLKGDVLTLVSRSGDAEPHLCCSVQGAFHRLKGSDLWAVRYRLARADEALLFLTTDNAKPLTYRGPKAPREPEKLAQLQGQMVERTLRSAALGETRRISIYLPPGYQRDRAWPALFLTDGGYISGYGPAIESLIERKLIPPLVVIGSASGQMGIVEDRSDLHIADLRGADYVRKETNRQRFEQHMTFFTTELVAFARTEYGVSSDRRDIAVAGYSNGGVFAFLAALRRPDVFGAAIPMSAGFLQLKPDDLSPGPRPIFFTSAGLYEGPFHKTTSSASDFLREAGYAVTFTSYAAGHAPDQWETALVAALPQAFARR